MTMQYPEVLEKLVDILKKIPAIGKKNAERMALQIFLQKSDFINSLVTTLQEVRDSLILCRQCNNISNEKICTICQDTKREQNVLCIVSNWQDLWALENHQLFNGMYHILMQEIDLQKGISPNDLSLDLLLTRVNNKKWQEIIIATSPTINGELTAQYINELLKNYSDVTITRIAHGLPVGATIHYADQFTLKKSLEGRKKLS